MKKTLFIAAALLVLVYISVFFGCAGLQRPPSICDDMPPGESVLCDIANRYGVRLETVGDVLLVLNLQLIKEDLYKAKEARRFFDDVRKHLDGPITAQDLKTLALYHISESPALLIASSYIAYLNVPQLLTAQDVAMLQWWIDYNLQLIESI
jgi:hypothetical protein